MPIFPRFVPQQHNNQTMDLNTLLSLLGEQSAASTTPHHYNQSPTHASAPSSSHPAAKATRSTSGAGVSRAFTPNFDIFETATEYVLEGELPGLADKKALDIEFTDHQTLLVKGRIEKNMHTASSSSSLTTPAAPETRQIEAEKHTDEHSRPHTPPRPTVEDDIDEDDRASTVVMTPTSTVVSHAEKHEKKHQQEKKEQIRYWVSERTIGSFQRTFSFPGLIDQDNVKARLENGLLTIVVPKRTKVESRRIEIQ